MIALVVEGVGGTEHDFERLPLSIGSDPACSLVIADAAARHAEIDGSEASGFRIRHTGGWFSRTKCDGKKVSKDWTSLAEGSRIEVASTVIGFRILAPKPYAASDRAEADLLAQIAGGDDGARLVYSDWLEQRGDLTRAEFLRVQHAIMTTTSTYAFDERIGALQALAAQIDVAWRRQVARQFVEGCNGFEAPCPRDWSQMQPTERADVRHCGGCQKNVYYCTTIDLARSHAMRGNCVAVDAALVRARGDINPNMFMRPAGMMPMPPR
jgi:uncharacterized protein (TIGR02996 family)